MIVNGALVRIATSYNRRRYHGVASLPSDLFDSSTLNLVVVFNGCRFPVGNWRSTGLRRVELLQPTPAGFVPPRQVSSERRKSFSILPLIELYVQHSQEATEGVEDSPGLRITNVSHA
ncbi:unnamed protein product [Soboliphyme baturini]|uniref:Uncharacterized protein n=1 Tax=Soboliphyme baturini TaxID=241478 RepID=A0A183IGW8_9BILA|nr:unnamed protein product [Soboliphyme baturini]